jgi:hypothetical protein
MSRCPTSILRTPSLSWTRLSCNQAFATAARLLSCATAAPSRSSSSCSTNIESLAAVNCHGVSWVCTVKPPAHRASTASATASGPARPARR